MSRAPALRRRQPHVMERTIPLRGGGAERGLGKDPLRRQRTTNFHPVPPMGRSMQARVGQPGSQPGAAPAEGGRAGGSGGKRRVSRRALLGALPCRSAGPIGPAGHSRELFPGLLALPAPLSQWALRGSLPCRSPPCLAGPARPALPPATQVLLPCSPAVAAASSLP